MQLKVRNILILLLVLLNITKISAQDELYTNPDSLQEETHDSIVASLLTCTPGTDVYAHFGHTAIRIQNFTKRENIVFNYGCFDASGEDFLIKFIKGETDYVVNAEDGQYFLYRYDYMGNGVTEQVLNLTQEETAKLTELLYENLLPQNRGYRYNWLYDNCTTRARDMIEKAINGKVIYENKLNEKTARNLLHECLANDSWLKLGIDLLLGTEIDTLAPRKIQQFIPAYYENDLNYAFIEDTDGCRRKMVAYEEPLLEEKDFNKVDDTPFSPTIAFSILLIIAILLSIYDYKRKKVSGWFDAILHLAQGIAGIIIAYLFFFSVHPAVSTNWQVIIFNPLYILYAVYIIYCHIKKKKDKLKDVNTAALCIFTLVIFIAKQDINIAVYLMAHTLFIRNIIKIYIQR